MKTTSKGQVNILMQKSTAVLGLEHSRWNLCIHGISVDKRGQSAINFLTMHSDKSIVLKYLEEDFQLLVNDTPIELDDLCKSINFTQYDSIVLESTTLGFAETYLLCKGLRESGIASFDMLYLEPMRYKRAISSFVPSKRDFELSEVATGYKGIPGSGETPILLDGKPQSVVFFLGFESERMDRALEEHPMIHPSRVSVVFGVPAFKPGWETDAFANSVHIMRDRRITGGVHFCGAENPRAAFEILEEIIKELEPNESMFIAPIGTKPHGIATALFSTLHSNIGILYDHPHKASNRTTEVGAYHLFEVAYT